MSKQSDITRIIGITKSHIETTSGDCGTTGYPKASLGKPFSTFKVGDYVYENQKGRLVKARKVAPTTKKRLSEVTSREQDYTIIARLQRVPGFNELQG